MKVLPVAILYQAVPVPVKNGIARPMKPGGYSDGGADIACALKENEIEILTPVDSPEVAEDLDWVFPDTAEGIQTALSKGAKSFWLNTVLYEGHPIEALAGKNIFVVGQSPKTTALYDDKFFTQAFLRSRGLPVPKTERISRHGIRTSLSFPLVIKPIRGRGSEGVRVIHSEKDLAPAAADMFSSGKFGDEVYAEEFLSGEEITITVMPPGDYILDGLGAHFDEYWSLPPVRRFNHIDGVAPYNGTVAVVNNSAALSHEELETPGIQTLSRQCEDAAKWVGAKAPIRVDCRADGSNQYFLFDLNMKPNLTGASRPHRLDQTCLSAIASEAMGWDFSDLILNMLMQCWKLE